MQGLSCRYVHRFRELRAAAPSNFDIVIARTQVHFFVLLRASQTATVRESVPYRTATVRESVPYRTATVRESVPYRTATVRESVDL
jgi:hypothetical protein